MIPIYFLSSAQLADVRLRISRIAFSCAAPIIGSDWCARFSLCLYDYWLWIQDFNDDSVPFGI